MPKGYILSAHRSEANPVKKAAYKLLALDNGADRDIRIFEGV